MEDQEPWPKGPIAAGVAIVTGLAGGVALFPSVMAMVDNTVAAADHQPATRTEVVVDDVVDGDTLRVRTTGGRDRRPSPAAGHRSLGKSGVGIEPVGWRKTPPSR
jgi:hypothetical protein